jgi:hypothetical protein
MFLSLFLFRLTDSGLGGSVTKTRGEYLPVYSLAALAVGRLSYVSPRLRVYLTEQRPII